MLILDLDNTIFETKSISPKIFQPVFNLIENYYQSINNINTNQLIAELWSVPIDVVFKKYRIPEVIQQHIYKTLTELDYNLNINTYDDYHILKNLQQDKILVTTGYEKLQLAKIKALQIGSDFKEIFIDDPLSNNRKFKLGIFEDILINNNLKPKEVWVIGDSSDNEIKAGHALGMNTIQRLKPGSKKSEHADYGITSFQELKSLIS